MKRFAYLLLVLVLLLALTACGANAPAEPEAPEAAESEVEETAEPEVSEEPADENEYPWNPDNIREQTFVLAHGMMPDSMIQQQYEIFVDEVARLSDGKMVVEQRIAGSLLTDPEALDGIMSGVADFVHLKGSFADGTIKDLSPMTLSGLHDGEDWEGFTDAVYDVLSKIFDEYGIKYLGLLSEPYSVIVNTKKPIEHPADTAGMTFRASGRWVSRTVEAWGGTATTIALADLTESFSRGSVEGVMTGWNIIVPFAVYEVADYITATKITENGSCFIMNKARFDSLNEDEQALIEYVGRKWQYDGRQMMLDYSDEYRATVEAAGNQVLDLTPEENQEFIDIALSLLDEMEPELGPNGLELVEILREWNGI